MFSIFSVRLEGLKNKSQWNFHDMVVKALTTYALLDCKFKEFIDAYLAAFRHEDEVFEMFNRPLMTEGINNADEIRDRMFRILRDMIKLYLSSPVAEQRQNAPGYEWIGIHAILNGNTHTITEAEE